MKKKVVLFTVADNNNLKYFEMFKNSLRKFHTEEELPLILIGEEQIKQYKDREFFYRATPLIASKLLDEYELVIKADCDQIVMGDLNHIINVWDDYDVGTVLNINKVDPLSYGYIEVGTIYPQIYYNCGLVAMRNKDFVEDWKALCLSDHFYRMPMREQGFLNILAHYGSITGRYNVRCLDRYDPVRKIGTWNGLVAKGEGMRMKLTREGVVLPRGEDGYPDRDTLIKLYHFAGGNSEVKMNYRTHFPEEIIEYIDWLVSDSKDPYER